MKPDTRLGERERIRQIWRPLYDLGYKGAEQIDAQYMAYVVSSAVTETQHYINECRIDELENIPMAWPKIKITDADAYHLLQQAVRDRIKELQKGTDSNEND